MNNGSRVDTCIGNIPVPIFIVDIFGKILSANRYCAELLDVSSERFLLERNITSFYEYPEDWMETRKRLETEGSITGNERFYHSESGKRMVILESCRFEETGKGRQSRIIIISRNITTRLQMEQQLMQTSIELSQANAQLQEMQKQLVQEKGMATLGTLSAGIAHEINNPLSFIRSNVETGSNYIEKVSGCFNRLHAEIEKLARSSNIEELISIRETARNLREMHELDYISQDSVGLFSEIANGLNRIQDIVKSLDIFNNPRINETCKTSMEQALYSALHITKGEYQDNIHIETDIPSLPDVKATIQELVQSFINILINAFEAAQNQPAGKERKLIIRGFVNEWVCCEIENTGSPIPADNIPKLFDPFFTTKKVGSGKGLGLTSAYHNIVHSFGGQIDVQSEESKTIFIVRLQPYKS